MQLSERNLIQYIREKAGSSSPGLVKGIGDDCSVFGKTESTSWLISTDMLVDGVHFQKERHPAKLLGRKSIAVNLSDIAAMGGIPRYALVSMSLTEGLSPEWLYEWLDGVLEILSEYDCSLVGGDTVKGKELNISVTVIGEQNPSGCLYRNGAGAGDIVYISAPLGYSAIGLEILKKFDLKSIDKKWEPFIQAHLDPLPQIHLGQIICESGHATAMQDISDGLATDLGHICKESGVGAVVYENLLPQDLLLDEACAGFGLQKNDCLLSGGEDYQLVFSVKSGCEKKLEEYVLQSGNFSIVPIGKVVEDLGVFLVEEGGKHQEITFHGYEHLI
jgi:thiamine-monophosphate kinase